MKYLEIGESPGVNRNCYSQRSQPLRLETVTLVSAQVCCNLRCLMVGLEDVLAMQGLKPRYNTRVQCFTLCAGVGFYFRQFWLSYAFVRSGVKLYPCPRPPSGQCNDDVKLGRGHECTNADECCTAQAFEE